MATPESGLPKYRRFILAPRRICTWGTVLSVLAVVTLGVVPGFRVWSQPAGGAISLGYVTAGLPLLTLVWCVVAWRVDRERASRRRIIIMSVCCVVVLSLSLLIGMRPSF